MGLSISFLLFLTEKEEIFHLKKRTPLKRRRRRIFFFFFFDRKKKKISMKIKKNLREGEEEYLFFSFLFDRKKKKTSNYLEEQKNIFLLLFLKNESRSIIFGSPSRPSLPPKKKLKYFLPYRFYQKENKK